jgi:hypothetical protein
MRSGRKIVNMWLAGLTFLLPTVAPDARAVPQAAPAQVAQAQTPPVDDFKAASSNQPGRQYPQVNSERRARFRIIAPQAQNVRVPEWGGIALTFRVSATA